MTTQSSEVRLGKRVGCCQTGSKGEMPGHLSQVKPIESRVHRGLRHVILLFAWRSTRSKGQVRVEPVEMSTG